MALPLPFDTQGLPVVNAITWDGGGVVPGAIPITVPPESLAGATTDAGSFADDYHNAALAVPLVGTCTFTAGGTAVVGVGTAFLTAVQVGQYIRANAHAATAYTQVASITDNLNLTLVAGGYLGAAAAAAASSVSNWVPTQTGGGVVAVAVSLLGHTISVAAGDVAQTHRLIRLAGSKGFVPIRIQWWRGKMDTRQVNNDGVLGVFDNTNVAGAAYTNWATFLFSGATNTIVTCHSGTSTAAGNIQTTQVPIPGNSTSAVPHFWEIVLRYDRVEFWCDDTRLAEHFFHIPYPYVNLYAVQSLFTGLAPAGVNALTVDDTRIMSYYEERAQVEQADANKLRAMVSDGQAFCGSTPRAPTNIADNLVHEITDAANSGMDQGKHYVVTQIGGADIQVYCAAGAAPAVATVRRSPFHLFNGIPWSFAAPTNQTGIRLWAVKSVDGTANADLYVDSVDGGGGY
jgi:hypothetical protein